MGATIVVTHAATGKAPGPVSLFTPVSPSSLLSFAARACLALRSRYNDCAACAEACPVGALRITLQGASLASPCLNCGQCAAVCPTGALAVPGFDLETGAAPERRVSFVDCDRVPAGESPRGAIRVPCLGGLSPARLVELKARAGRAPVTLLDRGWCGECPAGNRTQHPGASALQTARSWLRQIGVADEEMPCVEQRPLPPDLQVQPDRSRVDRVGMSRRGFLRTLAGRGAAPAHPQADAGDDARDRSRLAAQLIPPERSRLLAGLSAIAARTGKTLPQGLFPAVAIGESCRNHQICAKLCPTGALRPYSDDGDSGVVFDASTCISCGDCEQACPGQAIRLLAGQGRTPGEVTRLTRWQLQTCPMCEHEFTASGDERVCPECRKTRDLGRAFFGLHAG